jgi:hypothetical protein
VCGYFFSFYCVILLLLTLLSCFFICCWKTGNFHAFHEKLKRITIFFRNGTFQSEEISHSSSGLVSLHFILNIHILLYFRKTSRSLVCLLLKYQHSNNQNFETELRFFIAGCRLKAPLVSSLLPSGELRSYHAAVSSAFRTAMLVYKPGCENPPPSTTKKGLSSTQYLWFKRHGLCI